MHLAKRRVKDARTQYNRYMNLNELVNKNVRPTKARIAVMEALSHSHLPLSVDDVRNYPAVKKLKADPVTIYRILDVFVVSGLVKRIELGEGKFRYERTDREHHHHVICTSCGAMEDVADITETNLERVVARKTNYSISSHSLEFFGLCPDCQKTR